MAANNKWGAAKPEEAHLERAVQDKLLLSRTTRRPFVEIAVYTGSLHPLHFRISKEFQNLVQIISNGNMINIKLSKMRIEIAICIQPAIYITRLRLCLERGHGLIPGSNLFLAPRSNIMARKVVNAMHFRHLLDFRRMLFINQYPAIMRIANILHSDHLPLYYLQTLRPWYGQTNHRHPLHRGRDGHVARQSGTPHLTDKKGV